MSESQILTSAVSCNELWTSLTRRAMSIFNTNCTWFAILDKRQAVEPMHEIARDWYLQYGMRLFEVPLYNLNRQACDIVSCMLLQETVDVRLKLLIGQVPMQETYPQNCGRCPLHDAFPLPWHRLDLLV